ncbi:MAG: hypothetical protein JJE53_00270 [Candidatus Pacebacteria bacterium]|nr:hypothetical protein [Candidatus Paceibacterota bacterium]
MKFTKIKLFLIGIFILGIINIPSFSIAETQIEVQEGEINVETIPNNPQPYQDVTINLSSYATDLNKAIITWQTETGTVLSGIGKTSYSFTAKGPDIVSVITVNIRVVGSVSTLIKKIAIIPSEVEVVWESVDGYVPSFYRGKALPVSGGFVRVVAIPNTSTIKSGSGSITYTWKNNGEVILAASGYNKNSYVFKNSVFDELNEIKVTASSVGGSYGAENTITIPTYKPKVVFYKKSPTEGVLYNNALNKETFMTEDEMTVVAEPYFISLKGNESDFSYSWKINNESIQTPFKKTELTIRPASRGGYATINFVIENISELFQTATNQLRINI